MADTNTKNGSTHGKPAPTYTRTILKTKSLIMNNGNTRFFNKQPEHKHHGKRGRIAYSR